MRKTLNHLLSSLLLFPICFSCEPDKNPDPKFAVPDDKCYRCLQNMWSLLDRGIQKPEQLHDKVFAYNFAGAIAARNESEQNKNSVDSCLRRLFLRKQEMGGEEEGDYIERLKKISEDINQQNDSKLVIMGNTLGERKAFVDLGAAFKSGGVEYALMVETGGGAKVFFSDNRSKNKIFIDEAGKEYDEKDFIQWGNKIAKFECAVSPYLRLDIKANSSIAHLGGYCGKGQYGIPMFLSLFAARLREKIEREKKKDKKKIAPKNDNDKAGEEIKEIEACKIFLYENDKDSFWNVDFNGEGSTINMVEFLPFYEDPANLTFYSRWFQGLAKLKDSFLAIMRYRMYGDGGQNCFVFSPSCLLQMFAIPENTTFQNYLRNWVRTLERGQSKGAQLIGKNSLQADALVGICNQRKEEGIKLREEITYLEKEIADSEAKLSELPKGDANYALHQKIINGKKKEKETKEKEIKKLYTFFPAGKVLKISYVVFGDRTCSETIEGTDDSGKKNFELKIFSFDKAGKFSYHVDDKYELVEN